MILKIISLFLIFMVVLGMFGKLRFPWRGRLPGRGAHGRLSRPRKCRDCGRFLIGGGDCDCKERRGPQGLGGGCGPRTDR
jgi:hypothetical protein